MCCCAISLGRPPRVDKCVDGSQAPPATRKIVVVRPPKPPSPPKTTPPPQIVLRSAIFLIHEETLRPPGRVRAPRAAWEGSGALGDVLLRSSYSLEEPGTRCARCAGGLIDSSTPTQPPQAEQTRGQNQQHIISGQESSSPRPATKRQRRRCGRRTRARRGPRFRRQAHRYSGPFEARNADRAAPFVRLSAR